MNDIAPNQCRLRTAASEELLRSSTDLIPILQLPAYQLASYLDRESREPNGGRVPEILDALASESATRAALTFTDLCGLRIQHRYQQDRRVVAETLGRMLERCLSHSHIRETLMTLPTHDAIIVRHDVLKMGNDNGLDATAAAMSALMIPAAQIQSVARDLRAVLSTFGETVPARCCEKLTAHPRLSPTHEELLRTFREEIAPALFPLERYGYGALSDVLECVPFEEKEDIWGFRNPWGESPDLPSPHCHQCADSAPAARSFFVSRGIPADVYVIGLGNVYHNVCVAFFEEQRAEGRRHVPVLVDASPYDGFYAIEEGARSPSVSFLNPLGIMSVVGQRSAPLAFVGGDRLHVPNAGLAPWCCEDLPSGRGRVIGFGGVMASQKEASWLSERGTPEYYGNGIRAPRPELSLYVMPYQGNELEALRSWSGPFVSVVFYQDSGRAVACNDWTGSEPKDEAVARLHAQLITELEPLAERHLAGVHAMVKRSGYSLAERVFGQMGTLRTLK